MTKVISFYYNEEKEWSFKEVEVHVQVLKAIKFAREHKKDFEIEFREIKHKKTPPQLRGIHRLFDIIAKDFSKEAGKKVPQSEVKKMIKDEYEYFHDVDTKGGYYREYKSLEKATKQELADMIEITQVMGAKWGIEDCVLTSAETRAMIEYYNKR